MKKALALVLLFAGCSVEPEQVTVPGTIVTRDIYEVKKGTNNTELDLFGKWYSSDGLDYEVGFYYDAKDGKIQGETIWCRDYQTTKYQEYSFEVKENWFNGKVDGGGHLLIHYIRNHDGTEWNRQVVTSYSMIRFRVDGTLEEHLLLFPDHATMATPDNIDTLTPAWTIITGETNIPAGSAYLYSKTPQK